MTPCAPNAAWIPWATRPREFLRIGRGAGCRLHIAVANPVEIQAINGLVGHTVIVYFGIPGNLTAKPALGVGGSGLAPDAIPAIPQTQSRRLNRRARR